jgi:hypothetical protein
LPWAAKKQPTVIEEYDQETGEIRIKDLKKSERELSTTGRHARVTQPLRETGRHTRIVTPPLASGRRRRCG